MSGSDPTIRNLKVFPALLVLAIVAVQLLAWHLGIVEGAAKWALAGIEMSAMLALLWNGWRIRRYLAGQGASAIQQRVARLVFWSLAICTLGDLVNRNLPPRYQSQLPPQYYDRHRGFERRGYWRQEHRQQRPPLIRDGRDHRLRPHYDRGGRQHYYR